MAKTETIDIVAVLNNLSEADLEEIQRHIGELEKELDGLRAVEKMIDVRLNGRRHSPLKGRIKAAPVATTTNGSAGPAAASGEVGVDGKRRRVAEFLAANGHKPIKKIADATGINSHGPGCLSVVLKCDYFHENDDGIVSLTPKGEKLIPGLRSYS